ncbi:hypothetical protein F1D05_19415 [Kribbella qitaiheensis]|uniref:Uncharacterized protein n=1 Tax=Kribbella qitaiheensis TaxID=1544730 RepID=A0A7G6X0C8_9ACTN|nr:DUF6284 family protein [Kribbella qitaiheensis]QNE19693.1 hypothetical protein F1D05_19415 [Kribbella qitaiheensis]
MNIIAFQAEDHEPTAAELAEIEYEWPLIAAELDLLNAEIACITLGESVSVLDRRRVRRAERRVLAVARDLADDNATRTGSERVAS